MLYRLSRALGIVCLTASIAYAWIYKPVLNAQTGRPDLVTPINSTTVQAGSNVTVTNNADGSVTVASTGGGGGGSAFSLAITTGGPNSFSGVAISSSNSTTEILFDSATTNGLKTGGTYYFTLNPSSVTLQGNGAFSASLLTNAILNRSTLQSGATAYPDFIHVGTSETVEGGGGLKVNYGVTAGSVTDSGVTSTQMLYAGTGGLLSSDSQVTELVSPGTLGISGPAGVYVSHSGGAGKANTGIGVSLFNDGGNLPGLLEGIYSSVNGSILGIGVVGSANTTSSAGSATGVSGLAGGGSQLNSYAVNGTATGIGSNTGYGLWGSASAFSNNFGLWIDAGQAQIQSSMTVTGSGFLSKYGVNTSTIVTTAFNTTSTSATVTGLNGLTSQFSLMIGTSPTVVGSPTGFQTPGQLEAISNGNNSYGLMVATSTTGTPTLSVSTAIALAPSDYLLSVSSAQGASTAPTMAFGIQNDGHIVSSGTTPTPTSCGSNPVINGTDAAFTVSPGATATGCTVTFTFPFANNPVCIIQPETESLVNAYSYTHSTTGIVITQTGASAITYDVICIGNKG